MKRLIASMLLAGLCACSTVPTDTFNDKVAIGVQTVTATRKAATQALLAGKLSKAKDADLQEQLDKVVGALKVATALHATDPANAAAQLTAALASLDLLKAQAGVAP